jgi:AraC-like DNA-binding protein
MWESADLSISASTSRCESGTWGPSVDETAFGVVLPRGGAFHRRTNGQEHIVDRTTGHFTRVGEVAEAAHFEDRDHSATSIEVDPERGGAALAEIKEARGPFVVGSDLAAAHHVLLATMDRRPVDDLEIQERTYDLLGACITRAHPGFCGSSRRQSSAERRRLVAQVCEYLNTSEQISLVDVADRVHYSPFHLTRVFRSMTGITMSQYRTNLKLHDVLARLADDDTNLSEIAVSTGFIDHSHMTRTFVANVGATPSELRQVLRTGRPPSREARRRKRGWAPLPSESGVPPFFLVWR